MDNAYKNILSPLRMNDRVTLKNRVAFANGQQAMTQGPETWAAETTLAEMANYCAGGASIIEFTHYGKLGGGAAIRKQNMYGDTMSHFQVYDYTNPKTLNYLAQFADMAHLCGTKVLIRLGLSQPAWPEGTSYGGGDARSLFPATHYASGFHGGKVFTHEEMVARICPKEEIKKIVDEVAEMCRLYQTCGFDGMSFRCDRFIDADTNLRTDEYGGEIENRGRLCRELFTAAKELCGSDFLVEGCLMGKSDHGHDALLRHGYTEEEAIRFALSVEDVVDIIQFREEYGAGYQASGYNSSPHVHKVVGYCQNLRDAGFKKVIEANGGFQDPDDMEEAVRSGACDMIATSRSFIADSQFVQKLFTNGAEAPTPCLKCNKCHDHMGGSWSNSCSVNPRCCLTSRLPYLIKPPLREKKVAVIGGGPIGMRTACFAAERGHDVTLYEKTDYLGGKLKFADTYASKWPYKRYRLWLIDEMGRRGVKVEMNHEPSPDELRALRYDAILACTGSVELRPDVPGAAEPGVWTSEDVYEGRAKLGQNIVMVGGGEVATDTALHLAEIGKDITVLTRADVLMKKEVRPHGPHDCYGIIDPEKGYGYIGAPWEVLPNMKPICNAVTKCVTPNSVTYVQDGVETTLQCDSVIVNGGYKACTDEAFQYYGCANEFYLAGDVDADSCNNLNSGNISAFGKASLL